MGFLVFAYRKLSLKRKISDLQFRQMQLSMEKQQLTDRVSTYQNQMSMGKDILQQAYGEPMQQLMFGYQAMSQQSNVFMSPDMGNGQPNQKFIAPKQRYQDLMQQFMLPYSQLASQYQGLNSLFEQKEKSDLQRMHQQDTRIDQEMASLESQLKLMNAELQSVEKGEDEAAKQDAPKFGLG